MNRRHDIDALRAIAFALVILYHVGMAYVPGWHWHLKSADPLPWVEWPMRALNLWRLDLVFLVSGLALSFLTREGADRAALLRQRSARLLLPLAFGMAVVVPWQAYAQAVANGSVAPGFGAFLWRYLQGGPWPKGAFDGSNIGVTWNHLWFLPYLWLYTTVVVAGLPLLRSSRALALRERFTALRGWRLMVWPLAPLWAASMLLWPRFPASHDLIHDAWLHAVYFTLFLYGWVVGRDPGWWAEVLHLRWRALVLAALAFALHSALRMAAGELPSGMERDALRLSARLAADLYLWWALLAVLGFAHRHLDRPWPWLPWARESVYPWYVLHQTLIIVALGLLAPWHWRGGVEAMLVLALTVAACWALTDGLIRRSRWLRPLFGLAGSPRAPMPPRSSRRPQADPA